MAAPVINRGRSGYAACGIASLMVCAGQVTAQDADDRNYWIDLRLRNERVDQDNALEDADALTLRSLIGYQSDSLHGFRFLIEAESIFAMGERYNSTTNGRTNYSAVVDPDGSEINRAQISWDGLPQTQLGLGRQRIVFDNARFIGNVGWRQNEQTFDSVSFTNTSVDDLTIRLTYIDKVRRIFGHDSPIGTTEMSSPLVNVSYKGIPGGTLTLYGYFLDFDDAPMNSHRTLGARYSGNVERAATSWAWQLEYARQSDYKGGDSAIAATYLHAYLSGTKGPVGLGAGVERLGGDGTYAFQTPLATGHAFNGWADQFLGTPAGGLVDRYISVAAAVRQARLRFVYHRFDADAGSAEYGSEYDLLASRPFGEKTSAGIKLADYRAEAWHVDTTKLWLFVQYRY